MYYFHLMKNHLMVVEMMMPMMAVEVPQVVERQPNLLRPMMLNYLPPNLRKKMLLMMLPHLRHLKRQKMPHLKLPKRPLVMPQRLQLGKPYFGPSVVPL